MTDEELDMFEPMFCPLCRSQTSRKVLKSIGVCVTCNNQKISNREAELQHAKDERLIIAAQNNDSSAFSTLIEQGANIHADNEMAFRWACARGNINLVERLLSLGADPHVRGDDAFRLACINGHLAIVKILLALGVHPGAIGEQRDWRIIHSKHPDVFAFLEQSTFPVMRPDDHKSFADNISIGRIIGALILVLGIVILLGALTMDISVGRVDGVSIANMDRMNMRTCGVITGGVLFLGGLLASLFSGSQPNR